MQTTLDGWLTDEQKDCKGCSGLRKALDEQEKQIRQLQLSVVSLQNTLVKVSELVVLMGGSKKTNEAEAEESKEDEEEEKDEPEVESGRMEVEVQRKVKKRRTRRRPRKGPKILWVESRPAALPPSRARRKRINRQSFEWVEAQPP